MTKKDYIDYLNAVDKVCIDCMFYAPDTEDGEAACEQCPVRKTCDKMLAQLMKDARAGTIKRKE